MMRSMLNNYFLIYIAQNFSVGSGLILSERMFGVEPVNDLSVVILSLSDLKHI